MRLCHRPSHLTTQDLGDSSHAWAPSKESNILPAASTRVRPGDTEAREGEGLAEMQQPGETAV